MANLLEKLGFKKRTHVGISLAPNNFIELVCVDKVTKTVVKYASGNVKYNAAIREIIDYAEFTEVIENLFSEAGLNPSECSVTLNLPNVHFGLTQCEASYEAPFIIENIQTEIEDLYIFKRNEPSISYCVLSAPVARNHQTIAYSAMQTNVIGRIIEIFDSLGVDLVKIDSSYSALIKAIQYTERFSKYFENEEKTLVVLVTASSCSVFTFTGKKLTYFSEEPLAVRSLSMEEVYSTISKIALNRIAKENPNNLLVISETDELNAELLTSKVGFSGQNDFINKSLTISDSFIDITGMDTDIDSNMVSYMTIESVGAAIANYDEFEININFMPQDRVSANIIEAFGYEVDLYKFIASVMVSSILLAFILGSSISFLVNSSVNSLQDKRMDVENTSNAFRKRIDDNSTKDKKNVFPILQKVIENNNAVLNAYVQLASDIPDNVYIKRFVTNPDGGIGILGEAKSSALVEEFVNKLRDKNADLMVSKVSINSDNSLVPNLTGSSGLTFEIKTASQDISFDDDNLIQQTINNIQRSTNNAMQTVRTMGGAATPPPPLI